MKRLLVVVLAAILISVFGPGPAMAKEDVFYYATPMDFTKIYTALSRVWEAATRDYFTLVNMHGGVEGYRIEPLIDDHANEPQRGIELYEKYRKKGAIMLNTWSTPVAHAVLPRCMKDGIVLFTPGHGRGDALDGEAFPWIFPMGTNYQSESANLIEYIYKQEGKNLKGKKLAYVYLDTPFGREPLPVIQKLAKKLGFEIKQFGYSPPGNEQASVWTQVRRFRPDWVVLWGAGIGQAVAVKEAIRNGIPVDRITSCPHIYYPTVKLIGFDKAKGLTKVVNVAEGRDIPVIQAILKEVYGAGKGAGNEKYVGTMLYNSAIAASVFVPEAIRMAVKKYGKPVTAEKFRAACEQFKDFKAEGMMAPFTTSPRDHEGGGGARVVKFDGKKWVPVTEWFVSTFRPIVLEVAKESAAKFKAQGNPFKKPSIVVK